MILVGKPTIFGNIHLGKMFPHFWPARISCEKTHQSPRSELEDEIDLGFEGAEVSEIFWGMFFFGWEKKCHFHIGIPWEMVYLSNIWLTFLRSM